MSRACHRSGRGRRAASVAWLALSGWAIGAFCVALPSQAASRRMPFLHIDRWYGELAVDVEYENDSRTTSDQPDVGTREFLFGENLRVGSDGWVYHPALLQYSGEVGVRLEQDRVHRDSGGGDVNVNRLRLNYDLNLNLLPEKPYPISLFASQVNSQIDSPLAPRRTVDVLQVGAGLQLQQLSLAGFELPSRLLYRHEETSTSGRFGNDTTRDEFDIVVTNRTERTRNRFQYEFDLFESSAAGRTRQLERHDVRLFQDRELERGRLDSRLVWTSDGGDRDAVSLNLNELLTHRHTPNLNSRVSYAFNYQDVRGSGQMSHTVQAGFSHRFYESIFSSGNVGGSYFDSASGTIGKGNASLGLDYKKRIPGGRLGLRVLPSFAYQDENMRAGVLTQLDERHDVVIGPLIVLEQLLVVSGSIEVRDPVSLFVFSEGTDYDVVVIGEQTAIQVLPGSQLDPAVPPLTPVVSVQYDHETRPSRAFTTLTFATGASLDLWDHVTLDVSYSDSNQALVSGRSDDLSLDDTQRFAARLDLTFQHHRTHFEFERVRSEITPRNRYSASHDVHFRPTRSTTLGMGASYSRDEILDTDRKTDAMGVSLTGTARLTRRLLARLRGVGRFLDQDTQETWSAGGTASLTYQFGRLRFEVEGNGDWTRTDTRTGPRRRIEEVTSRVFFRVSRPF